MQPLKHLSTGVPNLDAVLGGGVPVYSLNIIAGPPGTGKTILAQQMLFSLVRADENARALYLTTLSEPTVKVVRYMQHFAFFDAEIFGERVIYQDLGTFIRQHPLPDVEEHLLGLVEELRPQVLVIDSFKAVRDLSPDPAEFRRFVYDLSVRLAVARCTTFLVGEYEREDVSRGAEFAVADGIFYLDIAEREGEEQRFFQVLKLRGQKVAMDPFPFTIGEEGIRVLSPALTLRRRQTGLEVEEERVPTGIPGLDAILPGGIPRGRTIILSGVSGTGKTTFALQFLVHGAQQGERGLLFAFEETPDRLHRMAAGFGWDLQALEGQGLLRIVYVPQAEIRVEEDLERMVQEVEAFRPRRFVVDSFSVFLHKVKDPAVQREKTFQATTLVQRAGAVGILVSDIPAGEGGRLSRFGVEETVCDGTIVLSAELDGLKRKRYLEVYKMRAADHVPGRHRLEITPHGLEVLYAPPPGPWELEPPRLRFRPLEGIIQDDLHFGTAWLVRGTQGVGKSALAYEFLRDGADAGEALLYVAADAPAYVAVEHARHLGHTPERGLETGRARILDVFAGDLDPADPEEFLFRLARTVAEMPKPLRVVFDSLTPLAALYAPHDLVAFVDRKNRLLRRPDVAVLDLLLEETLPEQAMYTLLNAYDVVIDLHVADWGEMPQALEAARVLRVRKSRGLRADRRPYPYRIMSGVGFVVQRDFYAPGPSSS